MIHHATSCRRLAAVILCTLLAACGGGGDGENPSSAPTQFLSEVRLQALAAPAASGSSAVTAASITTATTATTAVTADMVLDWAEFKLPGLFPKATAQRFPAVVFEGTTYNVRAYSGTWGTRYLGITPDGRVFGLGDFTNNALQGFETVAFWAGQVLADACASGSSACVTGFGSLAVSGPGVTAGHVFTPTTTVAKSGVVPVVWSAQGGQQQLNVTMWSQGGAFTGVSMVASPGTFGGLFPVNLNCNVGGSPQGCNFAALRILVDTDARTLTFDNSPIPTALGGTITVNGTLRW